MALRSEYTLNNPRYDPFLLAVVGQETNGSQLTVLSALARLDLDPWQEAARLSGLTREAATRALAGAIARLPVGDWQVSDSQSIAVRLVDSLPTGTAPPAESGESERAGMALPSQLPATWLIGLAVAFGLVLVLLL